MLGFKRSLRRVFRFLRGDTVFTPRDQTIRWLTLLVLTILLFTVLFGAGLVLTRPNPGLGNTAIGGQVAHPTATATPTLTPTPFPPTPTVALVARQNIPNFSHIFQIVLENTSYNHIIGNTQAPYINRLAARYGLATHYYAVTHPSLPNYFIMTAGSRLGVTSDCADLTPSCQQQAPNLPDLIEQSNRSWVAYFESMPTPCGVQQSLPYTIHYNPFVYYTDIVSNQERCKAHVRPYNQTQFFNALSANQVPNYVWLSPNLYNDMHENYGTIAQADQWLSVVVPHIIASPAFQQNGLIILTFDEGDDTGTPDTSGCCTFVPGGGHIVTLMISPLVKKGYQSPISANHYNLLRTIEDAWDLPPLGRTGQVAAMGDFFH
jgi:hypothetical protein